MTGLKSTLDKRLDQSLYMLKRQYGCTISIYQMGDATVDHLTGVKSIPRTVTVVRRAIILPVKIAREAVQTISIISANKAFVVGGTYDTSVRMFIVEQDDAPDLELTQSDWIIYRNRRYEVKSFDEYDLDKAWVIIGKAVRGDIPSQIYPLMADNLLRITDSVDLTP